MCLVRGTRCAYGSEPSEQPPVRTVIRARKNEKDVRERNQRSKKCSPPETKRHRHDGREPGEIAMVSLRRLVFVVVP